MKIVSYFRNYPSLKDDEKFQRELDYTSCFFAINAFLNEYLMKNQASFKARRTEIEKILSDREFSEASSRISTKEAGFLNRTIVSLMRDRKTGMVCLIGRMISILRKPITAISQKIY